MRSSRTILQEIRSLEEVIEQGRRALESLPGDFTVQLSLEQDERDHARLTEELRTAFIEERRHLLEYVIANQDIHTPVPVRRLSSSLGSLQDLVERISKRFFKQGTGFVQLDWVSTFAGSFGMLLTTDLRDNELFSKTYFSFEKLFDILEGLAHDRTTYRVIHDELTDPSVRSALIAFLKAQLASENDIRLRWGDVEGEERSVRYSRGRIEYLHGSLKRYQDLPDRVVHKQGRIKGLSLLKNYVEFVPDESQKAIRADANRETLSYLKSKIDIPVTVSFLVHSRYNEFTDVTDETWVVQSAIQREE